MDEFSEQLVAETVPVLVRVLGLPQDLAERAVRHAFDCPENPCPVNRFLLDRVNASTARLTGVPKSQVAEAVSTSVKAANDTLEMQRKLGLPVEFEQLRSAYDNSGAALDLTMSILMEKP
jgi:hypothetical protein